RAGIGRERFRVGEVGGGTVVPRTRIGLTNGSRRPRAPKRATGLGFSAGLASAVGATCVTLGAGAFFACGAAAAFLACVVVPFFAGVAAPPLLAAPCWGFTAITAGGFA